MAFPLQNCELNYTLTTRVFEHPDHTQTGGETGHRLVANHWA